MSDTFNEAADLLAIKSLLSLLLAKAAGADAGLLAKLQALVVARIEEVVAAYSAQEPSSDLPAKLLARSSMTLDQIFFQAGTLQAWMRDH